MSMDTPVKTIDEYIARYPADAQAKLQQIRELVHKIEPTVQEKISYGLATFTFHGNLVHIGAYDTHIGFYPGTAPIERYKEQLQSYETSKGTVRFPLDQPLPLDLIADMTRAAVKRNLAKIK